MKNLLTDKTLKEENVCTNCDGAGIVVDLRIEPICCENFDKYGGCCNCPLPEQVAYPEQCQKCRATGKRIV